jgi:hypothetical protein
MRVKLSEFRAAKTWGARYVGISGLGTNPTNPWCQRPCRPPLQLGVGAEGQRTSCGFARGEMRQPPTGL